ncbi:MAG: hypothetical protein JOY73_06825 [Actinobacteria bacterium]|nr:hypothetical protein [Actinomycetota bacterium]
MKALAVVAALALATAASAVAATPGPPIVSTHPGMPTQPGSVVGQELPLKAYADIQPTVHLFGDTLHAKLAVIADTRFVVPERLRVRASFLPYEPVGAPTLLHVQVGRFEQMTWTWTLRCLTTRCVPVAPPSEEFHVFRFPEAKIDYFRPDGTKAFGITAAWPSVEVQSQVSPGTRNALLKARRYNWQYRISPVAAPTFRVRPMLLFWLALGIAGAVLIAAMFSGWRWFRVLHPVAPTVEELEGSSLERALALLQWAHDHGDETLERKAFERIAGELGVAVDDLSATAHELAWAPERPEDDEVEAFTEQAREKGLGS